MKAKLFDFTYFWRVVRNGFILTAGFFFSLAATQEVTLNNLKTLIYFLGTYIVAELTHRYGLDKNKRGSTTLIL